ncbi:MAG: hemolysin family protein [Sandaracinaceae bacterium]
MTSAGPRRQGGAVWPLEVDGRAALSALHAGCYRWRGDDGPPAPMIALAASLLCVLANAFFVAAEFALAKVRPTALEAMAKRGDKASVRAVRITERLDAYLSATQLGITLASLGLGWLGEPALAHLIEPPLHALGISDALVHGIALTLAFSVISFLHIVVGELVPKSLAIQHPEEVSRRSASLLRAFFIVSYPALWFLNGSSNLVLRALRLPAPQHAEGVLSLEELKLLIDASLSGRGVETKRELIERVLRATDRPARAVMVPRVDMRTLSLSDDFETCMREVRRYGFSRYPLAEEGDPDRVVGYIYVKDLLMARRPPGERIGDLRRDILYVPEPTTVGDLLAEFQASKIPIALVVDEYGGTSGLVTLEDVVEEIVGDLQDEFHLNEPRLRLTEDGSVVADGSVPMGDLALDGLDAPEIEGAETVGAYVIASLGRLAHPGDRVEVGSYDLVVQDVRERRVHRVLVKPRPREDAEEEGASRPSWRRAPSENPD